MTTRLARDASIYWGSGATTPTRVDETRNVSIDLGADFVEDTVHGDVNRSFAPTFTNFAATITGLWNTAVTQSQGKDLVDAASNKTSGKFSIYIGDASHYFYGSAYIGIDEVALPYDDFATLNWSLRPIGTVGVYGV